VDSDRIEGKKKELEGEAQQGWGKAKDKARDAWDDAKDKAEDVKEDRERDETPEGRPA
jgi:uncharacterized protein YjbJ (UPF0337 family)